MTSCKVEKSVPGNAGSLHPASATENTPFFTLSPTEDTMVAIEFCNRCRWLHRATWVQTELFLTFPPPTITSITLFPRNTDDTSGRFRVYLAVRGKQELIWDRKAEGGFPELKVLKQRIRDYIQPGRSLGHSDTLYDI